MAHESGVPWSDVSGDRLRKWLGISSEVFYDPDLFAIVPMGFCFPGTGKQGDMAPRPECAPLWHERLTKSLNQVELTIYLGRYAFEHYLGNSYDGLTSAARDFGRLLPKQVVLPHPSPRNGFWIKKNPWFETRLLPALQRRTGEILNRTLPAAFS
jgi:uracil-DNA glycosylase